MVAFLQVDLCLPLFMVVYSIIVDYQGVVDIQL